MIIEIDDPADERLGDYALLNKPATRRQYEGDEFFIAEGYVSIDRVVDSGHQLRSVIVTPSRVERITERHPQLVDGDVPLYVLRRELLAETVGFDLHRGVVASAQRKPTLTTAELAASGSRRIAVLVGLNDAENVGVIARAARALGVDALLLDPACTDSYSRRTVRVSMGEVLHLPVARATTWPGELDELHESGFETWAMTPADGAANLWQLTDHALPPRLAIVLGAEGPGLDDDTIASCAQRVRIPIHGEVDSLNVGHAAAITFAAVTRDL